MKAILDLPPDVKEYLTSAAIEIATEQNFIPDTPEHLAKWFELNHETIVGRASSNMWDLLKKLARPGVQDAVTTILSAKTWETINRKEAKS